MSERKRLMQEIMGRLMFIQSYAPEFPEEDQTSTAIEFAGLRHALGSFLKAVRSKDGQRWMSVVVYEVEQADTAYLEGNEECGRRLLVFAEQHFKNAITGKKVRARFIADAGGRVRSVGGSDSGNGKGYVDVDLDSEPEESADGQKGRYIN
ncbi:MAG TPA: hypothetical protein VI756_23655 [Blastocatellia bacterium]